MPKRTDIRKILLIGSGPIVIGQACEFDYSGTQACKALREEGFEVVLVNSNPATIMTDPEMADRTYIEPLTPEFVAKVIARERPDALLPTVGGQTGLNLAVALAEDGTLERYGVELIGAKLPAIKTAEDRNLFGAAMERIGLAMPKGFYASSPEDALAGMQQRRMEFPLIIRPSFTLGGTGGSIAYHPEELEASVKWGLQQSPLQQVLVEESVIGWKEFELEVMRDLADNVVIICSIENFDPMGVHTGDSITVAPAQTLTDKEYQLMRDASLAIIREIGVETGGSNIQFGINPVDGRMVVIEMNPRVSRSSALASKATGFPIAKIAAKLAVGYTLDELRNDITRETPASFEPAIDYCVVEVPALGLREVPRGRPDADHPDEVGGRGHGDRPHVQGGAPEGGALARAGPLGAHARPARSRISTSCARRSASPTRSAASPSREAYRRGLGTRGDPRAVRDRSVVPRQHPRDRRVRAGDHRGRARTTPTSCARAKQMGFADQRIGQSDRRHRGRGPAHAAPRRHPTRLQDGRHLRGRVRRPHARTSTRPTRRRTRRRRPRARRWSSWAAGPTASARASSSTTRASTPPSRCGTRASKRSWSTATRRRSPPTTTRPTASTSSRSRSRT